jgi:hypothetical protein
MPGWIALRSIVILGAVTTSTAAKSSSASSSSSSSSSAAAASSTLAPDAVWYYKDRAQQRQGPISVTQMQTLFSSGALNGQTLGWRQGLTEWRPLAEMPALASVFPAIPGLATAVTDDTVDLEQPDFDYGDHEEDMRLLAQAANKKGARGAGAAAGAGAVAGAAKKRPLAAAATATARSKEDGEEQDEDEDVHDDGKKKNKSKRLHKSRQLKQTQTIYVSGLPIDTTKDEFLEFVRKCGMILEDSTSGTCFFCSRTGN